MQGKHWNIGKQKGNDVFSVTLHMEKPEDVTSTPSCSNKQLCDNWTSWLNSPRLGSPSVKTYEIKKFYGPQMNMFFLVCPGPPIWLIHRYYTPYSVLS